MKEKLHFTIGEKSAFGSIGLLFLLFIYLAINDVKYHSEHKTKIQNTQIVDSVSNDDVIKDVIALKLLGII
jgi:hypothetical protein